MQKRAPNRHPPPIPAGHPDASPQPKFEFTEEEIAGMEEQWRRSVTSSTNLLVGINMFQESDPLESCRLVFRSLARISDACKEGNLETLQAVIEELRATSDPVLRRPTTWTFWDCSGTHFQDAYENNHWHVIEYLARQPEFHLVPPGDVGENRKSLPDAVAERAIESGSIDELQRLLDLGWDINLCPGWDPKCGWLGKSPPSLGVTSNEKLVRWYLSHGADPNVQCNAGSTPMTFAAREASLSTMKLLVEHGGQVKGTDLVAQAAIGHAWGRPDRIKVIEYLLDLGCPIDVMSASTWKDPSSFTQSLGLGMGMRHLGGGGQTALNISQILGDSELTDFLIKRGANPDIEPLRKDLVEEFVYTGEHWRYSEILGSTSNN